MADEFAVLFDDETIKAVWRHPREVLVVIATSISDKFVASLPAEERLSVRRSVLVSYSSREHAYAFNFGFGTMYVSEEIVNRWVMLSKDDQHVAVRDCAITLRSMWAQVHCPRVEIDGVRLMPSEVGLLITALDVYDQRLAVAAMNGEDRALTITRSQAARTLRMRLRGDL